jgi:hypothetical protein
MSYFMKTDVAATHRNGRNIPFLLASLFFLIIAGVGARPAQALTYAYTGAAFDTAQCHAHTSFSTPPMRGWFHHGVFHAYRYIRRLFGGGTYSQYCIVDYECQWRHRQFGYKQLPKQFQLPLLHQRTNHLLATPSWAGFFLRQSGDHDDRWQLRTSLCGLSPHLSAAFVRLGAALSYRGYLDKSKSVGSVASTPEGCVYPTDNKSTTKAGLPDAYLPKD